MNGYGEETDLSMTGNLFFLSGSVIYPANVHSVVIWHLLKR